MKQNSFYGKFILILCSFILCGCYGTFSQKQEFKSISVEKAQWVDAAIRLNVGDLAVGGGATQLMNARFDYLQPTRRPEIHYEENGEKGNLSVQQISRTSVGEFSRPGDKNKWNILLSDAQPLNLDIRVDRGVSFLNLGMLKTRRINIECGRGDVFLDLLGQREEGLLVTIEGGEGYLEIKLPVTIGVRIQFKERSHNINMENFFKEGEYVVNSAYKSEGSFIDMVISEHTGLIQLKSL